MVWPTYFRRVRVDDPDVGHAVGALHDDLLHVLPDDLEPLGLQALIANDHEELDAVAQQLLRNALAR